MAKKVGLDKENRANRDILFDILAREGVDKVIVEFEGSSDDGSLQGNDLPKKVGDIVVEGSRISQGTLWHPNGLQTTKWKENCTVEEIVESLCYEVLSSEHGGWEINDGSFGEFIFDVKKRKAHLNFHQRYTESELFEHDF